MSDLRTGIGPIGIWGHLDTLPAAEVRAYVRRVADAGYGALWVPETVGREPFTLLGAVAEAAGSMWLGTSIVGVYGRDAMTAKMGAQTLHELTGGRFALGLGVSHPHLVQKLRGHAYEKPLSTIRQYVADLHRLPYTGPRLGDGSPVEPPILVAGLRERMLAFAATETDGAFPYLVTPERVAWIRGVLDAAAGEGRPRPVLAVTLPCVLSTDPDVARAAARGYLAPYLRPINYQVSWEAQGFTAEDWAQPGSDRLVDAMVAWGDAAALRERIAAMHAAGADHVAVIPLTATGTTEGIDVIQALSPRCPRRIGRAARLGRMSLHDHVIATVGTGVMAESMLSGLLESGAITPERIIASHPRADRREALARTYGIRTTDSNTDAAAEADIVVLGIKPQMLKKVGKELAPVLRPEQLVISILAGPTSTALANALGHRAIVRSMPNTPAQLRRGMTVWYATPEVTGPQREATATLLGALGSQIAVEDEKFVAMATAVSGTGPAYTFLVMEALIDAAVHLGFPRHIAHDLVIETLEGSAAFAKASAMHPAQLRNMVTSPGGTTAAALHELEAGRIRTVLSSAVWAAYRRTEELGHQIEADTAAMAEPEGTPGKGHR